MIEKWPITIPELTGDVERNAYIYVPDQAEEDPDARYPVLYMFDGHNVFFDEDATYGKSWGMDKFVEETELPMIIAAVECDHSPETPEMGFIRGKGRTTMEWLIHTFKAYVDQVYPTLPDRKHTFVAGSSMGGLMSLYAVMEYNHVFSRAACLSPSIWFATRQLDRMLRNAPLDPDTVVYMDYGSRALPFHKNMKDQFRKVASRLLERGVYLDCRIIPGGNHNEASWERQIPFFMSTLLYGVE